MTLAIACMLALAVIRASRQKSSAPVVLDLTPMVGRRKR